MSVDLSTSYLGLKLKNPIVAGASPMTGQLDRLKELEAAGVSAVVMPSLFEEQIEHEEMEIARMAWTDAEGSAEAQTFFPTLEDYRIGPHAYLSQLEQAKSALSIPVIASLNGVSPGGWMRYAKLFEDHGADAVELNIYYVATEMDAVSASVEQRYLDLVSKVKESISIPLAVKIGPYFSAMAQMATRLKAAGADGLVLFNRFMQPDIDLETLQVTPHVELSSSVEVRLPLRWVAILRGRVDLSLAATTGVHTSQDVLKLLLAGADVTMFASSLLRRGARYPAQVLQEMTEWLEEHEYSSIEQMKGSVSQLNCPEPAEFERANYMKALISYSTPNI
jgi:dihydroorotate dehydrogenase (fumarate)